LAGTLLPFDAVREQVEGDFYADAIERAVERHFASSTEGSVQR
jgi:hypothetical protein